MWDRAQQALMESTSRLLNQVASFLPGIVALIVALLISTLAAWVIGIGLRRFLARKASRSVSRESRNRQKLPPR